MNGPTQRIVVTSDPPGATVTVDSVQIGVTPVSADLARKASHILTVTHPSAAAETLAVHPTETSSMLYWNLLWGGLALLFIPLDIGTGAHREFPEPLIHFDLARRASVAEASRDTSTDGANRTTTGPAPAEPARWLDVPWGARVRVRAGGQPELIGRFVGLLGDTLTVETNRNLPAARRLRADIRSVDLSAGANRLRGAGRGAGFGAVAGFGAFALLGAADGAGFIFFVGVLGAAYGAAAGAVVGFVALPSDDWLRVYEWAP